MGDTRIFAEDGQAMEVKPFTNIRGVCNGMLDSAETQEYFLKTVKSDMRCSYKRTY